MILAVAAITVAAVTQAASVSWASGALKTPASADGGWSGTSAKATVSGSLYLIALGDADTEGTYAWFQAQYAADGDTSAVYKYFTSGAGKTATADASGMSASRTGTLSLSTDAVVGTYYAAVIYTTTATFDGASKDFYVANIASATVESADLGGSAGNLALYYNGASSGTTMGWTAVPEPTSGLLMLLGMAGLALRRKRA